MTEDIHRINEYESEFKTIFEITSKSKERINSIPGLDEITKMLISMMVDTAILQAYRLASSPVDFLRSVIESLEEQVKRRDKTILDLTERIRKLEDVAKN